MRHVRTACGQGNDSGIGYVLLEEVVDLFAAVAWLIGTVLVCLPASAVDWCFQQMDAMAVLKNLQRFLRLISLCSKAWQWFSSRCSKGFGSVGACECP